MNCEVYKHWLDKTVSPYFGRISITIPVKPGAAVQIRFSWLRLTCQMRYHCTSQHLALVTKLVTLSSTKQERKK